MRTTMATENNNKTLNVPNKREQSQTCLCYAECKEQSPQGNVPNLRFPEFSGEWTKTKLGDIGTTLIGLTYSPKDVVPSGGTIVLRSSNIKGGLTDYNDIVRVNKKIKESIITRVDDLLICARNGSARLIGKNAILKQEDCGHTFGAFMMVYRAQNNKFVHQLLNTKRYYSQVGENIGARINQITTSDLNSFEFYFPQTLNEQNKIASMLSLLDDRIATQIKIIEKLESLIRGLITDVNSGRIAKCESVYLRDLLTEQHEKNSNNYAVCSVSVSQGVINQIDYLGRSFAAKEVLHYNVVNCGDIVYTKSPTGEFPYGIVKRSDITKPVAVSPLYGVYRPINDYVGRYLHLYFKSPINAKNYLHKLIQKGAKNTINITNQHFLDNKILIPEKGWLDKIVNLAAAIEMKIATENKVLQTLQQQKDYLLSKMFI